MSDFGVDGTGHSLSIDEEMQKLLDECKYSEGEGKDNSPAKSAEAQASKISVVPRKTSDAVGSSSPARNLEGTLPPGVEIDRSGYTRVGIPLVDGDMIASLIMGEKTLAEPDPRYVQAVPEYYERLLLARTSMREWTLLLGDLVNEPAAIRYNLQYNPQPSLPKLFDKTYGHLPDAAQIKADLASRLVAMIPDVQKTEALRIYDVYKEVKQRLLAERVKIEDYPTRTYLETLRIAGESMSHVLYSYYGFNRDRPSGRRDPVCRVSEADLVRLQNMGEDLVVDEWHSVMRGIMFEALEIAHPAGYVEERLDVESSRGLEMIISLRARWKRDMAAGILPEGAITRILGYIAEISQSYLQRVKESSRQYYRGMDADWAVRELDSRQRNRQGDGERELLRRAA